MSDLLDTPGYEQSDGGLRPAASLTSIPVRRRRKDGAISPKPVQQRRPSPPSTGDAAPKPRKETFGKLQPPAVAAETAPALDNHEAPATSVPNRTEATPPEGIIALWESLAGENSIPSLIDLDLTKVAAYWPNSLLLRASGGPRRPTVEVSRIFSADAAHDATPLPVDTMTIDWMMALAREVTHDGVPVHELDNVSAADPDAEYGVIALPFGSESGVVDHVLCHLYRYDGPSAEEEAARVNAERAQPARFGRKVAVSIFGRRQPTTG